MVNGRAVREYDSNELRISIVYRARCFKSDEEVKLYREFPDSSDLSIEEILSELKVDMVQRNVASK